MAEENKEIQKNDNVTEETGNAYQEYIDTINELKANSVSKEKYDQLVEEKKGLIEALKSGQQIQMVNEEPEVSVEELRKDLYADPDKPRTNLEYVEKTLKLRQALIDKGEQDPFLPNGADYVYSQADADKAAYVAQVMQECVEYAQGDDQLFTNELMRRTKDDSPLQKQGRK